MDIFGGSFFCLRFPASPYFTLHSSHPILPNILLPLQHPLHQAILYSSFTYQFRYHHLQEALLNFQGVQVPSHVLLEQPSFCVSHHNCLVMIVPSCENNSSLGVGILFTGVSQFLALCFSCDGHSIKIYVK